MFVVGVCPVLKRSTPNLAGLEQVFAECKNFKGVPVVWFFNGRTECGAVHHAWLNADGDLCLLLHVQETVLRLCKIKNVGFAITYSIRYDEHDNVANVYNFGCSIILKEDVLFAEQKITWIKKE